MIHTLQKLSADKSKLKAELSDLKKQVVGFVAKKPGFGSRAKR